MVDSGAHIWEFIPNKIKCQDKYILINLYVKQILDSLFMVVIERQQKSKIFSLEKNKFFL
jgi:hypothetical protein